MAGPKGSLEMAVLDGLFVGGDTVDLAGMMGQDILRCQIEAGEGFTVFDYFDFAYNRVIIVRCVFDLGRKIDAAKKDVFKPRRGTKQFDLSRGWVGFCFG